MIQGWIIEGVQDHLICKKIVENYNISIRQAQRLIARAYNDWKSVEGINIEQKRNLKIAKLEQKIRSLKTEYQGTPAGLKIQLEYEREIIKLSGIPHPKVLVLEGNPEKPLHMVKRDVIIQEYNGE